MRACFFSVVFLIFSMPAFAGSAIFSGGCFWCTQADISKAKGVISTEAGFDGGEQLNPTYQMVSGGQTKYVESVRVIFNDKVITYRQLVAFFLRTIDPTDSTGQFCDKGGQYHSVIFYQTLAQRDIAMEEIAKIKKRFASVKTKVLQSTTFYRAPENHQHFAKKYPLKYKQYRQQCGRDERLKKVWGF